MEKNMALSEHKQIALTHLEFELAKAINEASAHLSLVDIMNAFGNATASIPALRPQIEASERKARRVMEVLNYVQIEFN